MKSSQSPSLNGRIVSHAGYGEHIGLTCQNHPELRWHAKNIAPLGCRHVFFSGNWKGEYVPECSCPLTDLRPLPDPGQ